MATSRFNLFINDIDISSQIKKAESQESIADWFLHIILEDREPTSKILTEFNNRSVSVRFRVSVTDVEGEEKAPALWRLGQAVSAWRLNEEHDGELILYGTGRLGLEETKDIRSDDNTQNTISGRFTTIESLAGVITNKRTDEGDITWHHGPATELARMNRNADIEFKRTEEVRQVTSPSFVLFLATSAASSYRLLYNSGVSTSDGSLLYSSLVLLPLAVEYFLKYLLIKEFGPLPKKYKNHTLLKLYDALPFPLQRVIGDNFEDELRATGRSGDSHSIRVCLMRFRNAFTAMRYLFDPENANSSLHLQEPNHIIILMCTMNALERVCGGPLNFRRSHQEIV